MSTAKKKSVMFSISFFGVTCGQELLRKLSYAEDLIHELDDTRVSLVKAMRVNDG